MTHPLRIEFPGAWYHVMNRGPSHRSVFTLPADYRDFLRILAQAGERFIVQVHAYCLMSTHFHLLLRTSQGNLGRAIGHLDGVYTQRYHRRHGTDGPLFRERYRAVLVQPGRHLAHVSRYIHLNPVEAGLASRPEDWPFSSYGGYLDPGRTPPWLTTVTLLQSFGSIGARQRYRAFVEAGIDRGTRDFYGRARLPAVLGDEDFRDELRRRAALELHPALEQFRRLQREIPLPLAVIARAVCEIFEVGPEALRPRSTRRDHALARGAVVQAARHLGGRRLGDIATWIGYASCDGAARAAIRFGEAAKRDPGLARRLAEVVDRARATATEHEEADSAT